MTGVLLTGGSGRLGAALQALGTYHAPPHGAMDVTRVDQVADVFDDLKPSLIVHAAAYTGTLKADTDGEEAAACWRTNVLGTRNLVAAARCPIVLISTEAAVHPYSFYVLTKMAAELEVARSRHGYAVIRTSFREEPWAYPQAFVDMWTIGDSVDVIAKLIQEFVDSGRTDGGITYIGTGPKTMYDLARRSRPDVRKTFRAEFSPDLPPLEELRSL